MPARRLEVRPRAEGAPRRKAGAGVIYAYLTIQLSCHIALLFEMLAPARVVFRTIAIGTSFVLMVAVPGMGGRGRGVHAWAFAVLVVVTLSALNPNGGAVLAVAAQWVFYVAVLAPLFWAGRLELHPRTLERVFLVLWAFQAASSVAGLLQVFFPGRFQPALTTFVQEHQVMTIRLASGEWVPRPMGLTDTPGGAGPSGFYATLLGFGMLLARPFRLARVLGAASMVAGMACVYLSQVRSAAVLLGICFITLAGLFTLSGRISGLVGALVIGGTIVVVGYEVAFLVGGESVVARLFSLTDAAPLTVYNRNRGMMLDEAVFTRLPKYPLGAGLGHWGMITAYFGSAGDEIGAELQWAGWVLDGGVPLILAYTGALLAALFNSAREALRATDPSRRVWVAIVAAYDVGCLALCFSYAPFMSTAGIEFWLLNSIVLHTSAQQTAT